MLSCYIQITVSVDIDGIGTVQVAMKRDSLVISLMFKAAESAGITLTANHAMFEVHTQLKIGWSLIELAIL